MKKTFLQSAIALSFLTGPALAIQPFYDEFKEKYGQPGMPLQKQIEEKKCNICHIDKQPKKNRNDFGQAVAKHLKKADFAGATKKFDPKSPQGKQALETGLDNAGKEKAANGQTFEQIIKGGKLP